MRVPKGGPAARPVGGETHHRKRQAAAVRSWRPPDGPRRDRYRLFWRSALRAAGRTHRRAGIRPAARALRCRISRSGTSMSAEGQLTALAAQAGGDRSARALRCSLPSTVGARPCSRGWSVAAARRAHARRRARSWRRSLTCCSTERDRRWDSAGQRCRAEASVSDVQNSFQNDASSTGCAGGRDWRSVMRTALI